MEHRKPNVRSRYLGRTLADALRVKRFKAREIAAELQWSEARVSTALTGKRMPRPVDLSAFLALCGITGPPRDRLLMLAEPALAESPLCEEHGSCLPADLLILRELEDTATSLTCVDMMAVPVLGQTEGYRRDLLCATPVIPDAEIDERLIAHRTRQRGVLNGDNPPAIRFFLAEHVLTDPAVDRDVLCDQVHHLLRLAVRPHVKIRVIPAHCLLPAVCPTFEFLTFQEARAVVYLEQLTTTTFLEHPTTIASYKTVLAQLGSVAWDLELSRAKLAQIAAALGASPDHSDAPETAMNVWPGRPLTTSARRDPDEHDRADL